MELEIRHLGKRYGNKIALDDVNFTVKEGVYGILGPNGAGKSTLMNLITMNLKPSTGEILWNGKNIVKTGREFRSVLGYVPQQQAMYPKFTVNQFLAYAAALHGMKSKEATKRIPIVLENVLLTDVANQKIHTLSGGMKQRLLLAQAILANPQVLILDEPTAGLDPSQRIIIRNLVTELAKERIVIISTHVVQDIENIAKEIIVINQGKVIRKASPAKLYEEMITQMPDNYNYEKVGSALEDVYFYLLGGYKNAKDTVF